jgi:phosphoglycerol geranylgeranyltransferase
MLPEDPGAFIARSIDRTRLVAGHLLPTDTNPVPRRWTHVTKVDPEPAKRFPLLYPLYLQHTDAVSVGGSSNVTGANTEAMFDLVDAAAPPAVHEPSEARHVTDETRRKAAMLAIPEVLNGSSDALVGTLGEGIEYLREEMLPETIERKVPWLPARLRDSAADLLTSWLLEEAVFEAYIIQNPDSAAAERSGVTDDDVLGPTAARRHATAADRHLHSEIVYVEYSGTYGGEEAAAVLEAIDGVLTGARIWYGGGIDDREKTETMLSAGADTVVVGDVFHRVAREETDLCARAAADPDLDATADLARVADWLAEQVRIGETSAAAYLRTIPGVSRPDDLATRYLSLSVALWLAVASGAVDPSDTTRTERRDAVREAWSVGYRDLVGAVPGGEAAAGAFLADVATLAGGTDEAALPVEHLSTYDG